MKIRSYTFKQVKYPFYIVTQEARTKKEAQRLVKEMHPGLRYTYMGYNKEKEL